MKHQIATLQHRSEASSLQFVLFNTLKVCFYMIIQ